MKLFIRHDIGDERRAFVRARLETDWTLVTPADAGGDDRAGVADADAVVSMRWSARMPDAPRLRLIQLPGAGFDAIDFDAVPAGAAVCNVYEHEIGIAEFVVLALLEWNIRLCRMDAGLREGRWVAGFARDCPLHGELHGSTVGFVGYGRIARASAARLRPFGVRTMTRTRTPSRADEHVDDAGPMDDLHAMLAASDYVVVTCPLTDETRGLIDAAAFAAMRPHAVVVNVARGAVIDEDALYAACRDRTIGGAIIDTWYRYPSDEQPVRFPSRHPFQDLDNVIMAPHASGWSAGLLDRRWAIIARNLDAIARGGALENVLKAPGERPRV